MADAQRVVVEVVERLHDDPDGWPVERMAAVAGYDPSHFSRVFRSVVGLRPGAYVRWLRLERAAHALDAEPERPIADVALQAGFESPDGFARAFRRAFGRTPSAVRGRLAEVAGRRGPDARPAELVVEGVVEEEVRGWSLPAPPDPAAFGAALAALGAEGPWSAGGLAYPWGWLGAGQPVFRVFRRGGEPVPGAWPLRIRRRRWLAATWVGAPWEVSRGLFWLHEGGAASLGHRPGFAPTLTLLPTPPAMEAPLGVRLPLRA